MAATAYAARGALAIAMDGHALNRAEHRALFNPDPEINSLAEQIAGLRDHGVPQDRLRGLLAAVRAVLELNTAEDDCHTSIAAPLDSLAASLRDAETHDPLHESLGIKAIARRSRPALRALDSRDGLIFYRAACELRDVLAEATPEQLRASSLRHELGAGPHDRLLSLAGPMD